MSETLSFVVHKNELERRFDPFYYQPAYAKGTKELETSKCKITTLGDISEFVANGVEIRKYVERGTPYLRVTEMKDDGIDLRDVKFVEDTLDTLSKKVQLQVGDILISRSGSLGLVALVDEKLKNCIISSHIIRVVLKKEIDGIGISPRYVVIFLRSKYGSLQFLRKKIGALVHEIDHSALKSIKIPIPPRLIQDKIAQIMQDAYKQKKEKLREAEELLNSINDYILDKLGIKIPEVKEKRSFVVSYENLERRFDVFYHQPKYAIIPDILESSKWEVKSLGGIIHTINYGASVKAYPEGEVPFLRIQNLKENELDLTDLIFASKSELIRSDYVKEGDFLISRSGTIGIVALIPKKCNGFAFGSFMIRFDLREDAKINKEFLSCILNSEIGKLQSKRSISGAVQGNITIPAIKNIKVPVPPLKIQNEIAKEVKRRREKAEQLRKEAEEVVKQAKEKVERMILGERTQSPLPSD